MFGESKFRVYLGRQARRNESPMNPTETAENARFPEAHGPDKGHKCAGG